MNEISKIVGGIIASAAMLFPNVVNAQQSYDFYTQTSGYWTINGQTGSADANPACYIEYAWQDGSVFQLIKDLEDGELYIYFENITWNIVDEPGYYTMRMNIYYPDGKINAGNYDYYLIDKNSISIPQLDVKDFIPSFMQGSELRMIMPGDIENSELFLQGSSDAINIMSDCISKSDQVQLNY